VDLYLQLRLQQPSLYPAVNLSIREEEVVMRVAIASIVVLLGSGVWCGAASTAAAQGQPAAGQGGAKYAHTLGASRFAVGDGSHRETEGPFERVIGDQGYFLLTP
jgi:hypothetical protein